MAVLESGRSVLVSGAAGFLGSQVARYLSGAPCGWRVRAGRRSIGTPLAIDLAERTEECALELLDPRSIARALDGCAAVVHCAVGSRRVTVVGTRNLLEAALRSGTVRRFVHVSSIAVYGNAEGKVTEATPIPAGGSGYAGAKAEAEALCRRWAAKGLAVVILRPTIIYGPSSRMWIDSAVERLRSGQWGRLGAFAEGWCNPVFVDDVASAISAAIEADVPRGAAFNINGCEVLTWNEWFERLNALLGLPPLRTVSPAEIRSRLWARYAARLLAKLLPSSRATVRPFLFASPGRGELALFQLRARYPADKAAQTLGWRPSVDLAEGLSRSIAPFVKTESL